jgi:uncharacterized protein (TIGR02246 family)
MKVLARFALLLFFASVAVLNAADAESEIKAALNVQVDAWNRGDIRAFVTTYADDCIFVGKQIARGREQLIARYQKSYPTREAMGHLSFSALEVHLLTPEVAIVTGEWHIERSGAAGNVGGLFSLVFQRKVNEWKIKLDHTN